MNRIELLFKLPLRDLIHKFPAVGTLLHDYGINCLPCSQQGCHVKDIFDHHQIPSQQEQILLDKIKAIVAPDQELFLDAKKLAEDKKIYSAPIQELVREHDYIRLLLGIIPAIIEHIDRPFDNVSEDIVEILDVIENYADKIHHAKEENILFKFFDEKNELVQAMYHDHQQSRAYRIGLQQGLIKNQKSTIAQSLLDYRALLMEHINQEDDILFPWIEGHLTPEQINDLVTRFYQADRLSGTMARNYVSSINRLVNKYQ